MIDVRLKKYDTDRILKTWISLNGEVNLLSENNLIILINAEVKGKRRVSFVRRMAIRRYRLMSKRLEQELIDKMKKGIEHG